MKKIVIVGGGFAGLNLIKQLSGNPLFEVILVDKNNYHFFPPLLYQVSTAFIVPTHISYPFRKLFQKMENVRFFMGSLLQVIPETNAIETENGTLEYDYLVLAMGTETNFFGNENVIKNALPMKSVEDAISIRNHILMQLEKSVRSVALPDKERLGNIVIAGGGPTGVEMAGMLAEMGHYIISKDYPEITSRISNIYLVDGGQALLGPMSKKAQDEACRVLEKLGVKILLNTLVQDYADDKVSLSTGQTIEAATLIWASGVIGRAVDGLPKEAFGRGRRINVDEINRVKGYANIFSIGDQCLQVSDKNYENGHPQLAQVAIQQGIALAKNLTKLVENKPTKEFTYSNKGSMAIISKYKAVVDLPKGFFKGFMAWLVWLLIHIIPLVGFRNKVSLLFSWIASFITNNPTLRLIITPTQKPDLKE